MSGRETENEKSMAIERAVSLAYDRIEPTGTVTGTEAGDAATEVDTVASFVRRVEAAR